MPLIVMCRFCEVLRYANTALLATMPDGSRRCKHGQACARRQRRQPAYSRPMVDA